MLNKSKKIFVRPNQSEFEKKLSIIHFNDVYNIESREKEPVGGAARFITAIEKLIQKDPDILVFFSGDALSPSNSKLY